MNTALLIGSTFGAVVGVIHAGAVFLALRRRVGAAGLANPAASTLHAFYFAVWTFVLWILCGSYVLYLWALASIAYAVHRLRQRVRHPAAEASGDG